MKNIPEKELFTDELIETTYLYCYKRLNNSADAEDLAQDILVEALRGIRSGKNIISFYSWYWALAYNRYCLFLRMKQNKAVSLEVLGGSIAVTEDITQDLIKKEDISALNYAVSRLSKIHREVIILYYLKEQKISEIALQLGIPEGTVKRRLFDAKTNIKKGVEKMNTYGKSSFAPAELSLWGCNKIPDYWNNIEDIMTKQIFVACSKEPVSVREIADEIGVAPVYFEGKLEYLIKNKFLKEVSKGSYLTDFCIFPEQVFADFNYELSAIYEGIGPEITEAIKNCEKEIRSLDFYGNNFDFSYLLWILYVYACTSISNTMHPIYNKKWKGKVADNNGKDYRIAGRVTLPDEKINYKDCRTVAWSNIHCSFQTAEYSHICYANLYEMRPFEDRDKYISDKNIETVMKIFDNPKIKLTPVQEEQAAYLISVGYMKKEDNGLFLTMPVMTWECQKAIEKILSKATEPFAEKYVELVSDLSEKMLLPYVRKDLTEEYVNWIMLGCFWPLNRVMFYGMYVGETLAIPDDYAKSAAATCLYINKKE